MRFFVALAVCSVLVTAWPGPVRAEDEEYWDPINRVEEDWVLWVYQPDGALYAPQFHTAISPLQNLDSYYFQVTWNYREQPDFASGGFQVQSWRGERTLQVEDIKTEELSRNAEIITWTQVLETDGHQLAFSILNGLSTTWGTFGHPETTVIRDVSMDLNQYSPDVSIAHSCVTYGRNRVIVLQIKQVRYYDSWGLVWTDETPRYVYRYGH
jgi:hypothetical protein